MVEERRSEIGVRIALGAGRAGVFSLVIRHGLKLAIVGIMVGLAGAMTLNGFIASLLFGVQPTDGVTIATVVTTIALVAALACGFPAWRASRLDPNVLLKHE
jgi:ABC-type antimicrobial peptide transport system permease subunit